MQAIKQILENHRIATVDELKVGEYITVSVPDMLDLTIEKVGTDELSVAHHYTQNGDLLSDPEIVFRIDESNWVPIEFIQHPAIVERDETGLSLSTFIESWNQTLHRQGYVDVQPRTTPYKPVH